MSLKSEWMLYKEWHELITYDKRDISYYSFGIQRNDGFIMTKGGYWPGSDEEFICKGSFGEFRFFASRKTENASTYLVDIERFEDNWPGDAESNKALCLAHLDEIREGLLRFPFVTYFDYKCIEEIE